ncbi:MAG: hypothetical protein NHB32_31870 [Fischerella sp. CENA71]|nr:hypothetical protein [Fischerella sp. CENA71]
MTLASRPIPSNKFNPCPVCENSTGACRILADETVFCHTLADAKKFERINGYICIKPAGAGHTATFKTDNTQEWDEEQRREWEARKQIRQQIAQEEARKQQERALSTDERHELYSEIWNNLKLDATTITDLRRRGFNDEEITRSGFKSVQKWQKLNKSYTTELPGIGKDGKSLVVGDDGYLCPIYDFDGKIQAFQVRFHNPKNGNRYQYLSTPNHATLRLHPENELPVAVFHPPESNPKGIAIVEGTGPKPYYVSQKLNYLVIGAAGGQHLSSPQLLKKAIDQATNKYGDLPITIIPDAGWALNKQVKNRLEEQINYFKDYHLLILDWNQIDKTQGDIDELNEKRLNSVRPLRVDSFKKKYRAVFENATYHQWAEERVKLTADIVQSEQWLSIPEGIEKECDLLFVRKALGGGKTNALIDTLKRLDKVALAVSYRNSLVGNTVWRANQKGLSAMHIKNTVDVIGGKRIDFRVDDSVRLYAGCADSFEKFDKIIDHNPDYIFIHDEICSILNHLKGGGTLKNRQQAAIEWDVNSIRNSKFAVMMDANLSDKEVNFIRELLPEKRIKVLDSVSPSNPRKFIFLETESSDKDYSMNAKYLPSQLVEKAKEVNRVLWISDSQRSCELADEILTKTGHKHFRLDGKTSHEDLSKQMQNTPKEFIVTQQLDSLSLSPSAESGLSIDLYGYFDAICFDIRGTVGVNTLLQMSARLRDTNVPIYVACPEFVNMTNDPCPYPMKKVEEVLRERIDWLYNQWAETEERLETPDFVRDMFAEMGNKFSRDPWFLAALQDAKQLKFEHQNLKLALKTALAQAGNQIIDLVEQASEEQQEEVKQTKEIIKVREAQKIFDSADIDWEKAQEMMKKDTNYDEKCQIAKARLKHELPGIEDTSSWSPELVKTLLIDEPQFLKGRWRLMQMQNEELAKAVFKNSHKYGFENSFTGNDLWKAETTKIDALKVLGVGAIITAGEFSSQDEWVQAIVNDYYEEPSYFNLIGITKAKKAKKGLQHVKTMVNRFLGYFGLECTEVRRDRSKGRWYSAQPIKSVTERKTVTTTPINSIYINGNVVTDIEPTKPEGIKGANGGGFLADIDECLQRRAQKAISDASEVSLSDAIAKQHEAIQSQTEGEFSSQMEDQRATIPSNSYINNANVARNMENQPEGNLDPLAEWSDPSSIAEVTEFLCQCEDKETLDQLRECSLIPPDILRIAARKLLPDQKARIREWVIAA